MRMRILRVFPRRTSMTPSDDYAFVGDPPMIKPEADEVDEVHVSCVFTWDKPEAERLALAWGQYYPVVKLDGCAYDNHADGFVSGRYVRPGITFTSRGCNNQCPWCLVPKREGKLREITNFERGHNIQDNNFLQCSSRHIERVFSMLRQEGRAVTFGGGLDSRLITETIADEIKTLRINQLFLACDTKEAIKPLRRAIQRIGLPRRKVRCYVLLKFDANETLSEATERMIEVWEAGAMPFAQLYQPPDHWIDYPLEWKRFARIWSRPPAMKAVISNLESLSENDL